MLAFVRAGFAAALVLALSVPALSADKSFRRDALADAAIKLEAQIKSEAGAVSKPATALRREADAAFARNDFRTGMQILGQIVAVAPDDSANWLRLARTVLQIRPGNDRERTVLLERAATAAYVAYQRSSDSGEEADSLVIIARTFADRSIWRPALDALRVALDLREVAEVPAAVRAPARGPWLSPARLQRRRGCGFAARLLSVLRGSSRQAHGFFAVRRRSQDRTSLPSRRRTGSFASRASSTASATASRCVPAFRRS